MPLEPPSSHGAPDVVDELRRQAKPATRLAWAAIAISAASLVVAILALFH